MTDGYTNGSTPGTNGSTTFKGNGHDAPTVEMPVGLKINDVPVLIGTKGAWPSLPDEATTHSGWPPQGRADGKPAYAAVLE